MDYSTDSDVSICTRLKSSHEFDDNDDDVFMEDEVVRDAVDGLMLLCCVDPIPDSDHSDEEQEREPPPSLEGRTWNKKKSMSVYKSCTSPPPSPENKHITRLQREMDSLLQRKTVFQQELEGIKIHQDELKAFNKKLRKKLEQSDGD